MNKFHTFISNNVLRIDFVCKVHPRMQIIPLKYITLVECHNINPPRIVIQYNTLHEHHRTEMEYASYPIAEYEFNKIQKGLEGVHGRDATDSDSDVVAWQKFTGARPGCI